MRFILRGRRSIWRGSRLTLHPPRILNDVSYVTRINHEMHFACQAQEMCFMLHCFECDGMGHEVNGTKKGFSCCLGLYSLLERQSGFPRFALAIEI